MNTARDSHPSDMAPPTFIGLVPMRHASERVQGKNYRSLGGKPLFHHIVDSLLACPYVAEVVIDTDSPVIAADATAAFSRVRIIDRPAHLRDGATPMNEVLIHDVGQVPADFYIQSHSTNPLLTTRTISAAVETFLAKWPEHDSLFAATRIQSRFWTERGEAINHDPNVLLRTQDLPPIYEENSNLYIFSADVLRERRNRIGYRPVIFEVDREEAWDIDEELDWKIVDLIYRDRQQVASPVREVRRASLA